MSIIQKITNPFLLLLLSFTHISEGQAYTSEQDEELIIIGGGHVGLVDACIAYQKSIQNKKPIKIRIYEKNSSVEETTAANIWISHSFDQIVSVVPRGPELTEKLEIPFNLPEGIRVNDVQGVNDAPCTQRFINQVDIYGEDQEGHEKRV